jgi:hypothetical protein
MFNEAVPRLKFWGRFSRGGMKKYQYLAAGVFMFCMSITLPAQNQYFDIGRFSFFLTPKVLKDGSIIEFGLGYEYTEHAAGELRLRFSNEIKNEQFDGTIPDSLNTIGRNSFEIFLMPYEYFFIKNPSTKFQTGLGMYYNYETLSEKGYFNMPALEALGKEKVNSFSNNFSAHILGPNIEAAFVHRMGRLDLSARGGIVPFFYLHTRQKMGIVPLMEPNYADFSKNTRGSPYFYTDIGLVFFKYISLALLYDFSRLNYNVIDFDNSLNWYNPGRTVITQSLKAEASLLIPLQGSVYTQIGGGFTVDSVQLDSAPPVRKNRQYLIFSAKMLR